MVNTAAGFSFSTMAGMSRNLDYRINLIDNITPQAEQAKASTEKLDKSLDDTKKSSDSLALSFIHNITVLSALREGINGIVTSLNILGVTNEKQYLAMRKMAAAVSLFIDTARAIKGIIALVEMLRTAEAALAVIESYRAFLKNPMMIPIAIGFAGVAGGVVGYMTGKSSGGGGGTTVNQTLNFNGAGMYGPSTNAVKRDVLEGMGGY